MVGKGGGTSFRLDSSNRTNTVTDSSFNGHNGAHAGSFLVGVESYVWQGGQEAEIPCYRTQHTWFSYF